MLDPARSRYRWVIGSLSPADGFGACPYTGLVKGGADGQFD